MRRSSSRDRSQERAGPAPQRVGPANQRAGSIPKEGENLLERLTVSACIRFLMSYY